MELGDFTELAKAYRHRTGYSPRVLKALAGYIGAWREGFALADVGAGTGKLTENLLELGLDVTAVEPNDAMRAEGQLLLGEHDRLRWRAGSAETTGLPDRSVDWVLMGSSFHWTRPAEALDEFQRILRPGGFFTAIWNPRHLEQSELHQRIEARIHEIVPGIQRVSSGTSKYTENLQETLTRSGQFGRLIFMEAGHDVAMSPERYLGAWRSVNDIQVQAGPERFEAVMAAIQAEIAELGTVHVPYRTRAWTVQAL